MAHPYTSLVQQALNTDGVALGTLAARSALTINSQMNANSTTFLMKRIRYYLQLVGRTAADDGPLIIGCARGDATISEIEAAMNERNTNGPEDITSMLDQDLVWVVFQNTLTKITHGALVSEGQTSSGWHKFAKKGIPMLETVGVQIFIYNAGAGALSTGSSVNGQSYLQGVWLRD